ncbi:MAG: hypothetical protein Kow00124_18980 [Anaerolineae bacterium]
MVHLPVHRLIHCAALAALTLCACAPSDGGAASSGQPAGHESTPVLATTRQPPALPTAPARQDAIPARVVVQSPDQTLLLIDPQGGAQPLAAPGFEVLVGAAPPGADLPLFVLAPLEAQLTVPVYEVRGGDLLPVEYIQGEQVTGLAVGPADESGAARIAWGILSGDDRSAARLFAAYTGGADSRLLREIDSPEELTELIPLRWSDDGQVLYYAERAAGPGSYMLFEGYTAFYAYDLAASSSRPLLPSGLLEGAAMCLDSLAPGADRIAHHCEGVGVIDLQSGAVDVVRLPAELQGGQVGSIHFNPAGDRLAFAAARGTGDDLAAEQGWVLVTDGFSGPARVVAASLPGSYYKVLGWLDDDTLALQLWSTVDAVHSVWAIPAAGGDLVFLSAGRAVAILR